MRHKDGNYRYVLDRGVVQRDRAGKVIRWIGSTTDITAEKTAIAEQKRVEEALRYSEAKFRRLFESNVIGIFLATFTVIFLRQMIFFSIWWGTVVLIWKRGCCIGIR